MSIMVADKEEFPMSPPPCDFSKKLIGKLKPSLPSQIEIFKTKEPKIKYRNNLFKKSDPCFLTKEYKTTPNAVKCKILKSPVPLSKLDQKDILKFSPKTEARLKTKTYTKIGDILTKSFFVKLKDLFFKRLTNHNKNTNSINP